RPAVAYRQPDWSRTNPSARDSRPQPRLEYPPTPAANVPRMPPPDRDNAALSPGGGTPILPALPPAGAQAHAAQIPHATPSVQPPGGHRTSEPVPLTPSHSSVRTAPPDLWGRVSCTEILTGIGSAAVR